MTEVEKIILRSKLKVLASIARQFADRIALEAEEIEAMVFKKTMQRSPEFHGGANR